MKKIKLPIKNIETNIILNALIQFKNDKLKQGIYTEPIDELILKLNIFELIKNGQFFFYARNGIHSHLIKLRWLN